MMARITIELPQGRAGLSRREGRIRCFPDGIERIIALPRRAWDFYDRLSETWLYDGLYENECFEIALNYAQPGDPDFERALVDLFALSIEVGWSVYNRDLRQPSNSNSTRN